MIVAFNEAIERQLHFLDKAKPDKDISSVEIYRSTKDFAGRVIRPLDDIADRDDRFPHPLWKQFGVQGFKGVILPDEQGGLGLGNLELAVSTMEIARASGAIAVSYVCDQALCSRQIMAFGTNEQKEKYLPKLITGDHVGALAMSEPEAGSDVMSMRTVATKVDGGYVIDGRKTWITNGARFDPNTNQNVTADTLVLYARTSDKPTRLTTFIVEGGTAGFTPAHIIEKSSTRGSDTAELIFDKCFVSDAAVLGKPGQGANILMTGLNVERVMFAANTLGVAQAALEESAEYLCNRRQFRLPIAFNQAVAHNLGDLFSKIHAAQDHLFSVAARADDDFSSLSNASAASVFLRAARVASEVTDQARYYFGGNGQTTAYRVHRQADVASLLRVGAGSEAMREMRLAQEFIPGYNEHLKHERILRTT